MMAVFYCRTGASDITKAILFLGLPDGKSWEKSFSNHSSKMYDLTTYTVNVVVKMSLVFYIEAIIKEKLKDEEHTDDNIKNVAKVLFDEDENTHT